MAMTHPTDQPQPVDRDVFDDPDLLDFEPPENRAVIASRMRGGPMPASVSTARMIMFVQPFLPIAVMLGLIIMRMGGEEETTPATTTTTVAEAAGEQAQRGGGAGVFLISLLGIIIMFVGLPIIGGRLKRMTSSARWTAIGVEALVLALTGVSAVRSFSPPMLALSGAALAVLLLLFSPGTKTAISQASQRDSSSRFDITNLPELDR